VSGHLDVSLGTVGNQPRHATALRDRRACAEKAEVRHIFIATMSCGRNGFDNLDDANAAALP
jgi:hypothetical protein